MFVKLPRLAQSRRDVLPKYRIYRKFQFPLGRRCSAVRYNLGKKFLDGQDQFTVVKNDRSKMYTIKFRDSIPRSQFLGFTHMINMCFSRKTKEKVCITIQFNSRRIGSELQHGRHFIVWRRQHGGSDFMRKPRILGRQLQSSIFSRCHGEVWCFVVWKEMCILKCGLYMKD